MKNFFQARFQNLCYSAASEKNSRCRLLPQAGLDQADISIDFRLFRRVWDWKMYFRIRNLNKLPWDSLFLERMLSTAAEASCCRCTFFQYNFADPMRKFCVGVKSVLPTSTCGLSRTGRNLRPWPASISAIQIKPLLSTFDRLRRPLCKRRTKKRD